MTRRRAGPRSPWSACWRTKGNQLRILSALKSRSLVYRTEVHIVRLPRLPLRPPTGRIPSGTQDVPGARAQGGGRVAGLCGDAGRVGRSWRPEQTSAAIVARPSQSPLPLSPGTRRRGFRHRVLRASSRLLLLPRRAASLRRLGPAPRSAMGRFRCALSHDQSYQDARFTRNRAYSRRR